MIQDEEDTFRDRISTVNDDGKRVWIYPKKPKGWFYTQRKRVSYLLILMLFSFPHIKINGEQMLLFNIIDRKFVLFGKVFWPQDMFLFALAIIIGLIFYQMLLVFFGWLFGQFQFFWEFEKKMLRRFGLKRFLD